MNVHLIDGTYGLFRDLYGQRRGVTLFTSGLLLRVMLTEAEKVQHIRQLIHYKGAGLYDQ